MSVSRPSPKSPFAPPFPARFRGFYAILDVREGAQPSPSVLSAQAEALLAAQPVCLQLRAKGAAARELAAWSRLLLPLAHAARVPFCVNDRLDVALAVGADAVHLGQDDLPLAEARRVAAGRLVVGISTHNEAQVREALEAGADYLGFGPVFPTQSKANPDPVVGTAELAKIVAWSSVPVVAIGGIDLANVDRVAATGVDAAAVIGAVARAANPTAAGQLVVAAFS